MLIPAKHGRNERVDLFIKNSNMDSLVNLARVDHSYCFVAIVWDFSTEHALIDFMHDTRNQLLWSMQYQWWYAEDGCVYQALMDQQ